MVIERTDDGLSPVTVVFVQSRNGLFSRRDELGCFNGGKARRFHSAEFLDENRIKIVGNDEVDNEARPLNKAWRLRFNRDDVTALDKLPKDDCDAPLKLFRLIRRGSGD